MDHAPGTDWQPAHLPGAFTTSVEGGYRLWLHTPAGAGKEPMPVLWVLDGARLFASVAQAAAILSRRADATGVAPMAVVGVDHDPPDKARREQDYSFGPCCDPAGLVNPTKVSGATSFLTRMEGSFREKLSALYAPDWDRQALLGHSLGGFFALHAWAMQPASIRVAGAVSPSIWWDAKGVQTALSTMPDKGQALFLAAGSREEPSQVKEPADQRRIARGIVSNARKAGETARQRLGEERVKLMVMEGEDHASTFLTVLPAFLRFASAALNR